MASSETGQRSINLGIVVPPFLRPEGPQAAAALLPQ